MARISEEDIARVREASDVVAIVGERVVLQQKGRLFWGRCPFHQEKTPSFKVDPSTQLFHCFGCKAGGDVYKFLMLTEQMDFPDAVLLLAERANIDIDRDSDGGKLQGQTKRLRAVCAETAEFYHSVLRTSKDPGSAEARAYLGSRGFGGETAKDWKLGFAPGRGQLVAHLKSKGFSTQEMVDANVAVQPDRGPVRDRFYDRVMFPISDVQERPIAFGGRVIDPEKSPKYLNSSDTPIFHKSQHLYGIHRAKATMLSTRTAIVVEGYTDVIALHSAGFTNAVAVLGTALTSDHIRLLSRFAERVICVFDGDEAGIRAAERAGQLIGDTVATEAGGRSLLLDVVTLPAGSDPADLVAKEDGAAAFQSLLDGSQPLVAFIIDLRLSRWDWSRPESLQSAVLDAAAVLAPMKGSIVASQYAQHIVDRLAAGGAQVDLFQVQKAIDEGKAPRTSAPGASRLPQRDDGGHIVVEVSDRPVLAPATTNEGRAEQEALALLAAHYALARGELSEIAAGDFMHSLHGQLFDAAVNLAGAPGPAEVLSAYDRVADDASSVLSNSVLRINESDTVDALARDLALHLRQSSLERQIQMMRPQMQSSANKNELTQQIVALQRDLEATRRLRHQQ